MGYPAEYDSVELAVRHERTAQEKKWGEQNHPNGTGPAFAALCEERRNVCDKAFKDGVGTYRHILDEEVHEAYAESDPAKLKVELIQVMAVCKAWIECIDRGKQPPDDIWTQTPERATQPPDA